jgi:hypothetical protein
MPRTRVIRITTDEETEMAMTAGLMKRISLVKPAIAKNGRPG